MNETPTPKNAALEAAKQLLVSMVECIEEIQQLAPRFPEEMYEARDASMEHMLMADYLERMARHNQQHQREIAAIRASVGAAWPTDPRDSNPVTGEPYANTWCQWFLLDAFQHRAELVAELIGLTDAEFTAAPDPKYTASNERSIKDVCEHVLHVQNWQMNGIRDAVTTYRKQSKDDSKS